MNEIGFRNTGKVWTDHDSVISHCKKCPRLVEWRENVARTKRRAFTDWDYWGKPVPGFGDHQARVLVLGLAPGAHGSNRTGRMFTGDASGDFLYPALYKAGFANQPSSQNLKDGLTLKDLFITAVCRCAPPGNMVTPQEIINCRPFLTSEIDMLLGLQGVVALGRLAFDQALILFDIHSQEIKKSGFSHGACHQLGNRKPWLLASYHPSRQNTQTGRLTEPMFADIWYRVRDLLA